MHQLSELHTTYSYRAWPAALSHSFMAIPLIPQVSPPMNLCMQRKESGSRRTICSLLAAGLDAINV